MRQPFLLQAGTTNPLVRILGFLAGAVMLAAAMFVGAFVFLAFLGLAVIGGLLFSIRVWWLRRQFRKAAARHQRASGGKTNQQSGSVIEGRVTSRRDD
ncbi:MAG: hypothetical protein JJU06_19475 [Ectothiorhodospiraceae bacterium]|nr:hypothetical protein [Ectothiorhodospiraceae bacterium]